MLNLTSLFDRIPLFAFSVVFIFFASINLPKSALLAATQESACETMDEEELPRDERYNYQLAIKQGTSNWLVCPSNEKINPGREINFNNPDNSKQVVFKWAVPASENNEFIYVSTAIGESHPLSLFRNSAAGVLARFIPFHEDELKEFGMVGSELKQQFIDIHHGKMSGAKEKFKKQVKEWHDTGLWRSKVETENLVRGALFLKAQESHYELGAERLIRIKRKRPLTSWIEFRSIKPPANEVLTVTLFYSGDSLESLPKYKFQFKEKK